MREASKPADAPKRGVWITNHTALLPQRQTWTLLPGSDRQEKRRQDWSSHLAWETWRYTWVLGRALLSSQPVLHHLGWLWAAVTGTSRTATTRKRDDGERQQRAHCREETTATKGRRFRAELRMPAGFLAVFTRIQPVSRTAFKYLGSREQCT